MGLQLGVVEINISLLTDQFISHYKNGFINHLMTLKFYILKMIDYKSL